MKRNQAGSDPHGKKPSTSRRGRFRPDMAEAKVKVVREPQPRGHVILCDQSEERNNGERQKTKSGLASPTMNSTLRIMSTLQHMRNMQPDFMATVQDEVKKSQPLQKEINQKVAIALNVKRTEEVYKGVLRCDVDEQELVSRAERQMALRAKAVRPQPRLKDPEPDIQDFFKKDFFKEYPMLEAFQIKGCETFKVKPSMAPLEEQIDILQLREWRLQRLLDT
ncbi:unnamed protein product [Darwinula stevensoni]|uniref:Protein phosphatase 1 regulatory subunit 35 C-terminal domain-containing protein n=1 Tax=Darwinula stevensoni TaxID=69355 RepID=A0A7R9A719_9CRUS|nr:unnamed protein product [Darwinula stevensoni]CAG0889826.1 unnamed protein product [Darwinula stevensoni]